MSDEEDVRGHVLAVADRLFYARGYQTVGMDQLRSESGISLKKLSSLFPSKGAMIVVVPQHRHHVWTFGVARQTARATGARQRLLAGDDFLSDWFNQDDFRGCAFINSLGELSAVAPEIAQAARAHKTEFQDYLTQAAIDAGGPDYLGQHWSSWTRVPKPLLHSAVVPQQPPRPGQLLKF